MKQTLPQSQPFIINLFYSESLHPKNNVIYNQTYTYSNVLVKTLLILLPILLLSFPSLGQLTLEWETELFRSPVSNYAYSRGMQLHQDQSIILLSQSGSYTTGNTRPMLHKFDRDGNLQWSRLFDSGSNAKHEIPIVHLLDKEGNTLFLAQLDMGNEQREMLLAKHNLEGEKLWAVKLTNREGSVFSSSAAMALAEDGSVYITGTTEVSGSEQVTTQKYNTEGSKVWESVYNAYERSSGTTVRIDHAGQVYVGGAAYTGIGGEDALLIKYDARTGEQLFARTHHHVDDERRLWDNVRDVLIAPDNSVYVLTYLDLGPYLYQVVLLKYNEEGSMLWSEEVGQTDETIYMDAVLLENGEPVILCEEAKYRDISDYFLTRYNADGQQQWYHTFNIYTGTMLRENAPAQLALSPTGELAVTGYTAYYQKPPTIFQPINYIEYPQMITTLYDQDGKQLQELKHEEEPENRSSGKSLLFDASGALYVVREAADKEQRNTSGMTLLKYSNCNGNVGGSASESQTICAGGSARLNATGGISYSWSPATGLSATDIANPTASPETTTTYTVTITNTAGCTQTEEVTITVIDLPEPTVAVEGETTLCEGETVLLSATTGNNYTYQWLRNGSELEDATSASYTASQEGSYQVRVTQNGCTATSDAVEIEVTPAPALTVTSVASSICAGSTTQLTASGATNYSWSPATGLSAVNIANPVASPSETTTYTVTGISNGCSSTATITITVNPRVAVSAGENQTVCSSVAPFSLAGASPAGGTWSGPGVTSGIFSPASAGPGTHTLTYTVEQSNCTATATKVVTVEECNVTSVPKEDPIPGFAAYPNPTDGQLHIELPLQKSTDLSIRLTNAKGQVVQEKYFGKQTGDFTEKLDLSGQARGVYFLQLTTEEGVLNRRIVVQ